MSGSDSAPVPFKIHHWWLMVMTQEMCGIQSGLCPWDHVQR